RERRHADRRRLGRGRMHVHRRAGGDADGADHHAAQRTGRRGGRFRRAHRPRCLPPQRRVLAQPRQLARLTGSPCAIGWADARCRLRYSGRNRSGGDGMDRRHFIGSAALAGLLPFVGSATAAAPARAVPAAGRRLLPAPLNPGDTVALVSPSAATAERIDLQLAREAMQALGFKVRTGAHYASRYGHLAGTDAQRAGDLNTMFADDEVKAIVCVRGGSGAARLLPLLDYDAILSNLKDMLGYSDITALHSAILSQAGLVTFHGPIGSGSWNAFNVDQFKRPFFQRELMQYRNAVDAGEELVPRKHRTLTITGGKARGELVGGNLTVLTALAGSKYVP